MNWPAQPVTVRVPATSANLGPGFDALGLALTLYDEVEVRVRRHGLAIQVSGEGEDTAAAGENHLVVRAMRAAFAAAGRQPPGLALRCVNRIPHGRGLGSSAAAIVAGVVAARALATGLARDAFPPQQQSSPAAHAMPDHELFALASEIEGHPDNVAACLAGGLTIAWVEETGPRLARLSPLPVIAPVACIAPEPQLTDAARQVLPKTVPHADAAANAGRSALLVAALTSDPAVLLAATEDRLHQPSRASVMPVTARLVRRLRGAGIPAVVSGAGPSVLVFLIRGTSAEMEVVGSIVGETGTGWLVSSLDVDRHGASVQFGSPSTHSGNASRKAWSGCSFRQAWPGDAVPPQPPGRLSPSATHGQLSREYRGLSWC